MRTSWLLTRRQRLKHYWKWSMRPTSVLKESVQTTFVFVLGKNYPYFLHNNIHNKWEYTVDDVTYSKFVILHTIQWAFLLFIDVVTLRNYANKRTRSPEVAQPPRTGVDMWAERVKNGHIFKGSTICRLRGERARLFEVLLCNKIVPTIFNSHNVTVTRDS